MKNRQGLHTPADGFASTLKARVVGLTIFAEQFLLREAVFQVLHLRKVHAALEVPGDGGERLPGIPAWLEQAAGEADAGVVGSQVREAEATAAARVAQLLPDADLFGHRGP